MKTTLNGREIEFDEKLDYLDFFLNGPQQNLVGVNFPLAVEMLQRGERVEEVINELFLLSRWVNEAPRKRHFRIMIKEGFNVLSTEQFFLGDDGPAILDALERTGKLAAQICEAYDREPMRPVYSPGPDPIPLNEFEKRQVEGRAFR